MGRGTGEGRGDDNGQAGSEGEVHDDLWRNVHRRKSPVVKKRDYDAPTPHAEKAAHEAHGHPDDNELKDIQERYFHRNRIPPPPSLSPPQAEEGKEGGAQKKSRILPGFTHCREDKSA